MTTHYMMVSFLHFKVNIQAMGYAFETIYNETINYKDVYNISIINDQLVQTLYIISYAYLLIQLLLLFYFTLRIYPTLHCIRWQQAGRS